MEVWTAMRPPDAAPEAVPAADPVLRLLQGTRALLTPEGAWAPSQWGALSAKGRPVSVESPRAVRWSLCGAMMLTMLRTQAPIKQVQAATAPLHAACDGSAWAWSCMSDRTQADVLALLDRAIAEREARGC